MEAGGELSSAQSGGDDDVSTENDLRRPVEQSEDGDPNHRGADSVCRAQSHDAPRHAAECLHSERLTATMHRKSLISAQSDVELCNNAHKKAALKAWRAVEEEGIALTDGAVVCSGSDRRLSEDAFGAWADTSLP